MNSGNVSGAELYWIVTTVLACGGVGTVLLAALRAYRDARRAGDARLVVTALVAIGQHFGMFAIAAALAFAGLLAGALPPNPNPPPSPFPPFLRLIIPLIIGSIPPIIIAVCLLTLWNNQYQEREYLASQEERASEQAGEALGDVSEVADE